MARWTFSPWVKGPGKKEEVWRAKKTPSFCKEKKGSGLRIPSDESCRCAKREDVGRWREPPVFRKGEWEERHNEAGQKKVRAGRGVRAAWKKGDWRKGFP